MGGEILEFYAIFQSKNSEVYEIYEKKI